jgi:hypothetical protein
MNRSFLAVLLFSVLSALSSSVAQAPDSQNAQRLLALTKEVQAQEAQMADNQKQIETKLAEVGEAIRVAKIYGGRSQ